MQLHFVFGFNVQVNFLDEINKRDYFPLNDLVKRVLGHWPILQPDQNQSRFDMTRLERVMANLILLKAPAFVNIEVTFAEEMNGKLRVQVRMVYLFDNCLYF